MDYTELYAQKKMTADQAAALVKSGDWVDYGWAVNTPVAVDAAIAKRLPELENVNFRGGILMWVPEIFQIDDPAAHMTWNSWHMGGIERKAIAQGFSFYSPIRYSELPRYYRDSKDPVDVAVFQVTPMDEHGYFNFGPCASHLGAVCEKAKKIIVEVNTNMPRCLGGTENWVHISQVAGVVEGTNPPDGSDGCTRCGHRGGPRRGEPHRPADPERCLPAAWHRRNAQRHRQPDRAERPAGSGRPYRNVRGCLCGHRQRPARSPAATRIWTRAVRSTPSVPAPRRCTITWTTTRSAWQPPWSTPTTSAVISADRQLHLHQQRRRHRPVRSGQRRECRCQAHLRCRRSAGLRPWAPTFPRAARASSACPPPSLNKKTGKVEEPHPSPRWSPGSIVTDTRANIHYLCTEYGCVNLKGLTSWEKAEALISVAHPDFRDATDRRS